MKKYYDALLYTFTFILIQVTASVIVNIAIKMANGTNAGNEKMMLIIASSALSGVAATLLFWKLGWCKNEHQLLEKQAFRYTVSHFHSFTDDCDSNWHNRGFHT